MFINKHDALSYHANDATYKDNAYFKEDQYLEGELAYSAAVAELNNARNKKLTEHASTQAPPIWPGSPLANL